ncbi:MAG: hypothetical protein WC011_00370 [Candidatus Paceibacterota bacterium]
MDYNKALSYYKALIEEINQDNKEVDLTSENYQKYLEDYYSALDFREQLEQLERHKQEYLDNLQEYQEIIVYMNSYLAKRTRFKYESSGYLEKVYIYPEF